MNKLNFVLKNNDEVVYDEILDYKNVKDSKVFQFGNKVFELKHSNNSFYFKRESDDEVFCIELLNNTYNSYVLLKSGNMRFDLTFSSFECDIGDNKRVFFKYNLEGDEEVFRSIEIKLI